MALDPNEPRARRGQKFMRQYDSLVCQLNLMDGPAMLGSTAFFPKDSKSIQIHA
jgi:hypothetical protein